MYRVPFQDDGGLCDIATAQDRRGGGGRAEGRVDFVLERGELLVGEELGVLVARDVDVDDAAAVDVGREEDGGEFNLEEGLRVSIGMLRVRRRRMGTYEALIFGEEHGDTGVNLADGQ